MKYVKISRLNSIIISSLFFSLGVISKNIDISWFGIVFMLISNIFYSFEDIKRRILFMIFNFSFFFFLLGKNTIDIFNGNSLLNIYSRNIVSTTYIYIYISLISIQIGAYLCNKIKIERKYISQKKLNKKILEKSCLLWTNITFICALITKIERVYFSSMTQYTEIFTSYNSNLPIYITILSNLYNLFFLLYLSTLPTKKMSNISIIGYMLIGILELFVGRRTEFLLYLVTILLYYFYREYYKTDIIVKPIKPEKWIGKVQKIYLSIGIPIILAFMSIMENIRANKAIGVINIFDKVIDLLYTQGGSINVILMTLNHSEFLKSISSSYTLGPVKSSFIVSKLLNIQVFKPYTVESAQSGLNLVYSLSYIQDTSYYLHGGTYGGSYIAEVGLDFGMIGLIIVGTIVGFILVYLTNLFEKNIVGWGIGIFIFQQIVMIPRGILMGAINYMLSPYPYIAFFIIYITYKITLNYKYRN